MSLPVVFYLLVLVLLAALSVYLLRQGWPAGLLRRKAPRKLQVSEIRSLGNRQFLVIAEYEATRLFLGVSQGRIDLLCHLGQDVPGKKEFAPLLREELKP
jgi:flagellar protein FliO/FliZ